jgi:hypothetical protein
MGTPTHQDPDFEDPLAELARLVGQDDPFRSLFHNAGVAQDRKSLAADQQSPKAGLAPRPAEPGFYTQSQAPDLRRDGYAEPHADDHGALDQAADPDPRELSFRPTAHEHLGSEAYAPLPYDGEHAAPGPRLDYTEDPQSQAEAYHHEDLNDDLYGHHDIEREGEAAQDGFGPAPLPPDLWAESGLDAPVPQAESRQVTVPRPARRPLVVLAAVLVLTGGGLAATFLARSTGGPVASGKVAPTILAAAGPNKVKLTDASAGTPTPEDGDAALLNRSAAASSAPVKVVDSQEQPVDLGQLPKSVTPADNAATQNGAFPLPKKVKTFLVRADGSMISQSSGALPTALAMTPPAPAAQPAPTPALPSLAAGITPDPSVASVTPAPRPATPKTSARATTTPKFAPKPTADVNNTEEAATPPPPSKARQAASPGVRPAAKPKPVEVADAGGATDATLGSGGAYGVQLAASPNEQDAREAFARLQRKFPDQLSSLKASVRKAETGDKAIYRVRVSNLSQDEAKTLCSQLQASGGSCYVVH